MPSLNTMPMKKCIALMFTWVSLSPFAISGFGQNVDSLKRCLPIVQHHEKSELYFSIAADYHARRKIDSAAHFARAGFNHVIKSNDSIAIVRLGWIFGGMLQELGKIDSAIIICKIALDIAEQYRRPERRSILNQLGICYTLKAEYDKALKFHYRALTLNSSAKQQATSYLNIGFVHYKLCNYQYAIHNYQTALRLNRQDHSTHDLDILYINIALAHAASNQPDSAQVYLNLAMEQCRTGCRDHVTMQADFAQGVILFNQKKYREAKVHFFNSKQRAESYNDTRLFLDNTHYLADILMLEGRVHDAIILLQKAEKIVHSKSTPFRLELIKLYDRLADAYRTTKDFQRVAHFQQQYISLRDSLYGEELTNKLVAIQAEFLERENTAMIARQSEMLALNQSIIKTQYRFNILVGILALLALTFIAFLIKAFQRKKRVNTMLDQRVRDRTRELEQNHTLLLQTIRQHEIIIDRISNGIQKTLKSAMGLCNVAMAETNDSRARDSIERVQQCIGQLTKLVQQAHQKNRLNTTL